MAGLTRGGVGRSGPHPRSRRPRAGKCYEGFRVASRTCSARTWRCGAFRAVDALVRNINSVLGAAGDMYGNGEGPINGLTTAEGTQENLECENEGTGQQVALDTTGYKRVFVSVKLRDRICVDKFREAQGDSDVNVAESLQSYLGLPFEQYSVLNPRWIQRLDGEDRGVFLLQVPLNEIVGLQLQPSLKAEVRTISEASAQTKTKTGGKRTEGFRGIRLRQRPLNGVIINGSEAKMGSSILDELVDLSFALTISQEERRFAPGSGGRQLQEKTFLTGSLLLDVQVNVPMPLSKLPRRVLTSAGGALVRIVVQRMLKGFLALLAKDFEGWCKKEREDPMLQTGEARKLLKDENYFKDDALQ